MFLTSNKDVEKRQKYENQLISEEDNSRQKSQKVHQRERQDSPKDNIKASEIKHHFVIKNLNMNDFKHLEVKSDFLNLLLDEMKKVAEKYSKTIDIKSV